MEKILVIGAGGQIGVELTLALRASYGDHQVIATDIKAEHPLLSGTGPYYQLDVLDKKAVADLIQKEKISQIYLLAAILSATGEARPMWAWDINMSGLTGILEIARTYQIKKLYWPSSIAVFGNSTPKKNTPQHTIIEPTTVYGISKYAGELWCNYYFQRYGLDTRSIRYPGIISWKSAPGGGTTDYAIEIFHQAIEKHHYTCFLAKDTYLPMMYMDDAIRGTLELMEAPADQLKTRTAYNLSGMSFSPQEIATAIQQHIPDFTIDYQPDYRQEIAATWPASIDDQPAKTEWGWMPEFDLATMTRDMLHHLERQV